MEPFIYSLLATLIVSGISFIGVLLFFKKISEKHSLITSLIAFAAGALIGDALLHLIPESVEAYGFETMTMVYVFIGILFMLLVEAYFHCSHESVDSHEKHRKHVLAKINILGDGLHNFLDGIAIAASFLISPVAGIASTFAIILHEIPQEFADMGILLYSNWSKRRILFVNFVTALVAVIGAIFALVLNNIVEGAEKFLIPIAAGQFIYIALADLLPEIHAKSGIKKYIIEITMFLVGFLIMYALTTLE